MRLIKKINAFQNKIVFYPFKKYRILRLIRRLRPRKTNKDLIRMGGGSDGGYLIPDDLLGVRACFSAGVGNVSEFEYCCAEKGLEVFMADASVEGAAFDDLRFNFIKKFIGKENKENRITLEQWLNDCKIVPDKDLLLQMDIEGDEFDVINSTSVKTLYQFRIIAIEFHDLHLLFDPFFFKKAKSTFRKILKNHVCVHIHPNNCCGIKIIDEIEVPVVAEFTFLRKDRVYKMEKITSLPHNLDKDNTDNESIKLPKIWY